MATLSLVRPLRERYYDLGGKVQQQLSSQFTYTTSPCHNGCILHPKILNPRVFMIPYITGRQLVNERKLGWSKQSAHWHRKQQEQQKHQPIVALARNPGKHSNFRDTWIEKPSRQGQQLQEEYVLHQQESQQLSSVS